jgi:small subunit ribosomal protein S17
MKKKLEGTITDSKNKTAIVLVERRIKHPKYKKYMKRGKNYKAHDENSEYKAGDKVVIEETRPISKDKHFKIIAKI